jgi:hypothetical protein
MTDKADMSWDMILFKLRYDSYLSLKQVHEKISK